MKKIVRMFVFSGIAVFATSLFDRGFVVHYELQTFLKTIFLITVFHYLIAPFIRLILLPLNIITLGLVSVAAYFVLFYFFISWFPLIEIKPWIFNGTQISYLGNIAVSAISLTTIINLLEKLL